MKTTKRRSKKSEKPQVTANTLHVHGQEGRIVMMPMPPQGGAILTKTPNTNFADTEKLTLKFRWNLKGPQVTKIRFTRRNRAGELTVPDLKARTKLQHTDRVALTHRQVHESVEYDRRSRNKLWLVRPKDS